MRSSTRAHACCCPCVCVRACCSDCVPDDATWLRSASSLPLPQPGLPIDNMCTTFSAMGSAVILPLRPGKGYEFEVAIFGGATQVRVFEHLLSPPPSLFRSCQRLLFLEFSC